ncbi:hypothetical protein [Candidatus Bartonella washoeensis]|uniref:Uncharacterized protein n=1 Tax=Cardidatus Bartonella washoeensis 085-0475 TaxID=1094564 RepID=J0QEB1_9HYPH|nr:hypothetical protein [Bartonella washoeensis]EJF83726.1 hypothetical protein MCW_01275 [Bartonella washoeensis 085-0475]
MAIDNQQSKQSSQVQSSQERAYASLLTDSIVDKESKLRSFKNAMFLSKKDYIIIVSISIVMLIFVAFQSMAVFIFLFQFFRGLGSLFRSGFFSFLFSLPVVLWALSVIFLPVVLVLHLILDRKLKTMMGKMEKSSQQHKKPATV